MLDRGRGRSWEREGGGWEVGETAGRWAEAGHAECHVDNKVTLWPFVLKSA